jgi:hypothetical protein
MKTKWLLLLLVFCGGSYAIGCFAKAPWDVWLETCLILGAQFWINKEGLMKGWEGFKHNRLMGVIMIAALTILFVVVTIHSALHWGYLKQVRR